jgi:hypothetical protein
MPRETQLEINPMTPWIIAAVMLAVSLPAGDVRTKPDRVTPTIRFHRDWSPHAPGICGLLRRNAIPSP